MSEPRKPVLAARVSTHVLELAIERLALDRYPVRLHVIDQELARRKKQQEMDLAATGGVSEKQGTYAQRGIRRAA